MSRTSAHFSIMITKNSPSVGDMEEGTYMEKAMWTWRETRGSAKLTFGLNFVVLNNYLCEMINGTSYHQYRGPDLLSLDIFFLLN